MSQDRIAFGTHRLNLESRAEHVVELVLEELAHALAAGGVNSCPSTWTAKGEFIWAHAEDVTWSAVRFLKFVGFFMSIRSRDWVRMERRVVMGAEELGLHCEEGEVEAGVGAETEGEGLPFMYISA